MDIGKSSVCLVFGGNMSLNILLCYFLMVGIFTIAIDFIGEGLINVYI